MSLGKLLSTAKALNDREKIEITVKMCLNKSCIEEAQNLNTRLQEHLENVSNTKNNLYLEYTLLYRNYGDI